MENIELKLSKCAGSQRLDLAIVEHHSTLSRRKARKIIDDGGCFVNKKRTRVASRLVRNGDHVKLFYYKKSLKLNVQPMNHGQLVFENNDFIIINKPAFLPSQPMLTQSKIHLIPWLTEYCPRWESSLFLVHRLDMETSGLMIVAKSKKIQLYFLELFKNRKIQKKYYAVVNGNVPWQEKKVVNYLSAIKGAKMTVHATSEDHGKSAETKFKKNKSYPGMDVVICKPVTGRSHQIRVHLDGLGFPVVGDKKYGSAAPLHNVPAHMLFAFSLKFKGPHDNDFDFALKFPEKWQEVINLG